MIGASILPVDRDTDDGWACPTCSSITSENLGQLGLITWHRCRDCGGVFCTKKASGNVGPTPREA